MRIINISTETSVKSTKPMCACIGYFDGMHLGHQRLVAETVKMAKEKHCESSLITFDPDPWAVVKGMKNIRHISTLRQRMNKAVSLGINNIVILHFTKEMSQLAPEAFISDILGRLNLQGLVCGFDFHFGHMGKGDAKLLKEAAPYEIRVIEAVNDSIGKISSTRISKAIEEGDMSSVRSMVGEYYQMEGTVIHGRHQGTGIGFPTANLKYSDEYLMPKTGVYAGYAKVGRKTWHAMINIGHNPTFNYKERLSVEAHLIGCDEDLYGSHMVLFFVKYIREEQKFKSRNNLIMQLEQDVRNIERILEDNEQRIS